MDIEEYLRQKRELEAKKQLLESKEKLDHDKERLKKERDKIYAQHGVQPRSAPTTTASTPTTSPSHHESAPKQYVNIMPSAGPGMWNTLILLLILILLVVSYFLPRYGVDQIRTIVKQESGNQNIDNQNTANGDQTKDDTQKKTTTDDGKGNTDQNNSENKTNDDTTYVGPKFSLSVKDIDVVNKEERTFDNEGKLDGEILVVSVDPKAPQNYEDFKVILENKEDQHVACKIDREVSIDSNFDGKEDIKDVDLNRAILEFKPKEIKTVTTKDAIPGNVKQGTYEGKGDITATYEARCYFCLDKDCNKLEERGETKQSTVIRVWINRELDNGNNNLTTNNTNRTLR